MLLYPPLPFIRLSLTVGTAFIDDFAIPVAATAAAADARNQLVQAFTS